MLDYIQNFFIFIFIFTSIAQQESTSESGDESLSNHPNLRPEV